MNPPDPGQNTHIIYLSAKRTPTGGEGESARHARRRDESVREREREMKSERERDTQRAACRCDR